MQILFFCIYVDNNVIQEKSGKFLYENKMKITQLVKNKTVE